MRTREKKTTVLLAAFLGVVGWTRQARADMVLDWNAIAANSIVPVAGQVPPRALIRLAMVQVAIYDAVNAIEGYPFQPYATTPTVVAPASPQAAAAQAAHDVLVALFPGQQASLDSKLAASLATIADPDKTNGISVGQQTAAGILAARVNDGRNAVVTYTYGSGLGVYIATPPGFLPAQAPEVARVLPFALETPWQFRAEAPPTLDSDTWVADYNETKALGAAVGSTRTPEQTDIGRFWGDNPVLQWNRTWRRISLAKGLSLEDNARYFAMLSTASADSLIGCWDSKYFYSLWRPVTAIRAGGGNPVLTADPTWISKVVTPNHPEYPAAHGCFSGASTETLAYFFSTDTYTFQIDSKVAGLTSPVRTYNSFSQALDEVLLARIYGGMHYRNSTHKGAILGKQASHFTTRHFFQRVHGRGNLHLDGGGTDDDGATDSDDGSNSL